MTNHPRTLVLSICLAVSAVGGVAQAQTIGYNVRTGDVWVDNRLGEINDYGTRYRDPFISEMSSNYGAPRSYIDELLTVRRWAPGDVYYACAIAHALNRPCREIVREYDRDGGRGWGVTAKRLGIKPGSPAFHALKRGTVSTYDRWGYPIVIDRDVRVDWSKHGPGHKGNDKSQGKHGNAGNAYASKPAKPNGKPASASHGPSNAGHKGGQGDAGKGNGKGGGQSNGKGNGKGN